ncbi:MAG: MotA/TolQ/ExbB proton channel [Planctomycetaceae bacterium]|nr:MotA/TolQ/ExbB proton channel [Planctomycetaceae bacterium]
MQDLLGNLSGFSTYVIAGACAVHLFAMFVLWIWARRDLKTIASLLDDFTRGLKHRSSMGASGHLSEQIEAFLADVREVLDKESNEADRSALLDRMNILDEKRNYMNSLFFETCYNLCRTMIEAYPLAGVLGTILAIGAALQGDAGPEAAATVSAIVGRFGDAIWSTFAGLSATILLMFLNGFLEPPFTRLSENRKNVRETVSRVKRELSLRTGEAA